MSSFYILSAAGGGTSITASAALNMSFTGITVDEFACSPTCSLDVKDAGATASTGTTLSSGSITTTTSGDLVLGVMMPTFSNTTFTSGAGFTTASGAISTFPSGDEYQIQTTAGAITAIATAAASSLWAAHVIAFKP
jgi:hypothetical protein